MYNGLLQSSASLNIPELQAEPALYVLFSVNDSSQEMSLLSGWGVSHPDRVTIAEFYGGSERNLSFAAGQLGIFDGPGGLGGRDYSPLHRIELNEANALYVQRAIRQESVGMENGLFVQHAVRASELESRLRDALITSQSSSATSGVTTLFDPFALGTPKNEGSSDGGRAAEAEKLVESSQRGPDNSVIDEKIGVELTPPAFAEAGNAGYVPNLQPRAAAAFSSQLQSMAAEFRPHMMQNMLAKE
jgi:hypothetical protein